jgi:hypothetical protein
MINTYTKKAGFCLLTVCSLNAMEQKERIAHIPLLVEKQEITHVPGYLEELATAKMFGSFSYECTNHSPIHLLISLREVCAVTNYETQKRYVYTLRDVDSLIIKPFIGDRTMRGTVQGFPLSAYHMQIEAPKAEKDDALIITLTESSDQKPTKTFTQKIPWNALFNHNYHSQKPNQIITKTHNTEVCVEQHEDVKWPLLRCNIAITYTHKIVYSESIHKEKI